jgi:outer membrane protein TolC
MFVSLGRETATPKCLKVLLAMCLAVQIASCVGVMDIVRIPKPPDLFRGTNPTGFTAAKLAAAMAENRGVPVSAVAGDRSLSLEECRAIALKRNLEFEVARLEEFSKIPLTRAAQKKMLPTIAYSNEISNRDNYRWGYSDTAGGEGRPPRWQSTGAGLVTNWSYGHERGTWTQRLELKWNLTDAALAYYMSKSSKNEELKGHFKRVRVGQELIGTVDAAYFRLLGLQEAMPLAARTAAIRTSVEKTMRTLHGKQLKDIADYHRVNEKAIRAQQELASLRAEILRQRNVLASALGISPDACVDGGFCVVGGLRKPIFCCDICDMELTAVRNRPESFVAGLDTLTSIGDLKKTIVKCFPKITGFWRKNWDTDKYIWEKNWNEVGALVNFDLMETLSNNDEKNAASTLVAKKDREMANVALGITSKVRVAALKYMEALDNLANSERFLANSEALLRTSRVKAEKDKLNEIALEEIEGDVLGERMKTVKALGEANAALAELQSAMGTNYNEPAPACL